MEHIVSQDAVGRMLQWRKGNDGNLKWKLDKDWLLFLSSSRDLLYYPSEAASSTSFLNSGALVACLFEVFRSKQICEIVVRRLKSEEPQGYSPILIVKGLPHLSCWQTASAIPSYVYRTWRTKPEMHLDVELPNTSHADNAFQNNFDLESTLPVS